MTKNENNKEKERKHWIPNQVGDDNGCDFKDDKLLWILDQVKDDRDCGFPFMLRMTKKRQKK